MGEASLWAFLGVSISVIVTPGPDTAVMVRNALGGARAGLFTSLGIVTGQVIWVLATSVGLVALLVASAPVFAAVKFAGAAYLIWLGVQTLRAAMRARGNAAEATATGVSARTAYLQGLVSDLGNPKMALFFSSLLPQFAPAGAGAFAALVGFGLAFCVLAFTWLAVYALAVARAGDILRRPAIRRWLEGVMGAVLVALGVRLIAEQR
jgi:threonine/homoserine/homoserine lactone efflux protein